jgi:hypothetical protein
MYQIYCINLSYLNFEAMVTDCFVLCAGSSLVKIGNFNLVLKRAPLYQLNAKSLNIEQNHLRTTGPIGFLLQHIEEVCT